MNNLADRPEYRAVRDRLRAALEGWPLAISAVDGLGSAHEIVERLARALPSRGAV